jgi:hypothetical protein
MATAAPVNQPIVPPPPMPITVEEDDDSESSEDGSQAPQPSSISSYEDTFEVQPSTIQALDEDVSLPQSSSHGVSYRLAAPTPKSGEPRVTLLHSTQNRTVGKTAHKEATAQQSIHLSPIAQRRAEPTAPSAHYWYPGPSARRNNEPPTPMVSLSDISFMVKPFSGTANSEQSAEKWLHSFDLYSQFKNIEGQAKLNLFKLMLTDQAAAWLMALPDSITCSWDTLLTAFHQRYGLTEAEKWKYNKDIWSREQGENQTVDDYVTSMQIIANRVGMSQNTLKEAIIQGLKPELRLFVLNAQASDIPSLLHVARTCEAARSADKPNKQADGIQELRTMVSTLMCKMDKLSDKEDHKSALEKRVTFAQAAVTTERQQSTTRRSVSPSDRREADQRTNYNNPVPVQQSQFNHRPSRTSNQYPTAGQRTWNRGGQQQQSPWNTAPQWSASFAAAPPTQDMTSGNNGTWNPTTMGSTANCGYCGRQHPFGKQFCRAANIQCFNCSRIGHLSKMCRRPRVTQNAVSNNSQ